MNTELRSHEWNCLCPRGSIKAWSVRKCGYCGAERPDTAAIAKLMAEAKNALEAVEVYERMSLRTGKGQAMAYVLGNYGGKR